jgi:hypothetical protein
MLSLAIDIAIPYALPELNLFKLILGVWPGPLTMDAKHSHRENAANYDQTALNNQAHYGAFQPLGVVGMPIWM